MAPLNTECTVWKSTREYGTVHIPSMQRRLEDEIRELCSQAIATRDSPELQRILKQLRAAIHEHTRRIRKVAASYPYLAERRRPAA